MRRRLVVVLTPLLLVAGAAQCASATQPAPVQTKAQAEIRLLGIVTTNWRASRMPGLVDPRTQMLANNTQAVCQGRGMRRSGGRYSRFVCVVRPLRHRHGEGLYVSYRAVAGGRWECHWLSYRRR